MKGLQGFFGMIYLLGFIGNGLLFLYVEWFYISKSFLQIFNPLLQIQVIVTLLTMPLFWILLVITLLGLFASKGASEA